MAAQEGCGWWNGCVKMNIWIVFHSPLLQAQRQGGGLQLQPLQGGKGVRHSVWNRGKELNSG